MVILSFVIVNILTMINFFTDGNLWQWFLTIMIYFMALVLMKLEDSIELTTMK